MFHPADLDFAAAAITTEQKYDPGRTDATPPCENVCRTMNALVNSTEADEQGQRYGESHEMKAYRY